MGGAGKTPFVEYLAEKLLKMNHQPAILTRGYRRGIKDQVIVHPGNRSEISPEMVGDEPLLLSANLPDVILGVDADRCRSAAAILQIQPDITFLLDDGFQHRRMPRQLDIALIDVSRWSGWPLLFPITHFRDVKSSLRRAGIFILTRSEGLKEKTTSLKRALASLGKAPVLTAIISPLCLKSLDGSEEFRLESVRGKKVSAFCGLANNRQFFQMVENLGAKLCAERDFPDHHRYSASDLEMITDISGRAGAELIVTTQKDAVKIAGLKNPANIPVFFLKIGIRLDEEQALDEALLTVLQSTQVGSGKSN